MIEALRRMISSIQKKVYMIIGHGIVHVISNSAVCGLQELSISCLRNEKISEIPRIQEYGLETYPDTDTELDGAPEAVAVFVGGNRDQGIVICVGDRRYRITNLNVGEVALYTKWQGEAGGHDIKLKVNQEIEMNSVTLDINCTGDIEINCDTANIVATSGINLRSTDGGSVTGIITGESMCHYTGNAHADVAAKIKAEKT